MAPLGPLRIVLVNPYTPPPEGGIEKEMAALSSEWRSAGHDVSWVTTTSRFPSGVNAEEAIAVPAGVRLVRLRGYVRSVLRGFQPSRAPLCVPGLSRQVVALRPNLVVLFNMGWPLTVRPVLARLGQVATLYRTYWHPPGGRLRRAKERLLVGTMAWANRLVAASEVEREQILASGAVPPARVAVVPPGVASFPPDPGNLAAFRAHYRLEGKRVVLSVGRLGRFKGTGHLIEVLPEVRKRSGEDVVLLLVGQTEERPVLDELIARHRVAPHVRLTGALADDATLRLAYRAADVFALPSAYESLGFVYLEALAEGVPVVACRGGGVAEVVGDSGIVLPEFGDRDALADALVGLLADEGLRHTLGESGRKRVLSRYLWRHAAQRFLELGGESGGW